MKLKRKAITAAVLVLTATAWAGWTSETVASEGDVGKGCCLAVDRWGRPHITYIDNTQGQVMYARYTGSSWEIEAVASDVEVTGGTALTLDAFDKPYVVFQDNVENELTYAYRSATKWSTETIATDLNLGIYLSINAWPVGPRVTYTQPVGMPTGLRYAYREDAEWKIESIVPSGGGNFNTLFTDNDSNPNVVYSNESTRSIRHAIRKGTEWAIDDIAEGTDCDAYVGPNGKVHISFAKIDNEGLDYAVSTGGGSWKIENVPNFKGLPAFTQICVNGAGNIFISYFNFEKWDLHIMTKQGGTWTHEIVATGAYVGLPHSSGISGGYPLIAYYDADNKDLKLARYSTDVELTSFAAKRARGGVDIRWAVHDPGSLAGYNLYRSAADGEREKVNAALVEGVSPFRYRDAQAPENVALRYWLEAVATTGMRKTFGPASVPPAAEARTFALYQNAPNPFAGATTFAFELPEASDVKLAIYDVAGRKVADVAKGRFAAGRHEVPFANELAPGVYVYRLDAASQKVARKMVVLK
jgi:hypothetical protein